MRGMTLEQFVAGAPEMVLDELAELCEWAELGARLRAPPGEMFLADLYGQNARKLRARQVAKISTYTDSSGPPTGG